MGTRIIQGQAVCKACRIATLHTRTHKDMSLIGQLFLVFLTVISLGIFLPFALFIAWRHNAKQRVFHCTQCGKLNKNAKM